MWLCENTQLKIQEISDISGVHELKIIMLQSGTCVFENIEPASPVELGIMTEQQLQNIISKDDLATYQSTKYSKRYIPKMLRIYIPGVIKWFKLNSNLKSTQIALALGTTTKRINEVMSNEDIQPIHPLESGIFNKMSLAMMLG